MLNITKIRITAPVAVTQHTTLVGLEIGDELAVLDGIEINSNGSTHTCIKEQGVVPTGYACDLIARGVAEIAESTPIRGGGNK
jgi:hypothetical protein